MRTTSRKLKRLIEEEEKTLARIEELQGFLQEIREARKKEEDLEIVKSIRGMKLGARELFDLLTGIREGTISMEMRESLLADADDEDAEDTSENDNKEMPGSEAAGKDAGRKPDQMKGHNDSPEREGINDDR